jgi:hypothetical protein
MMIHQAGWTADGRLQKQMAVADLLLRRKEIPWLQYGYADGLHY